MKPEAFEHILTSLHEAALDDACWSSASAQIDEALGTHGNTLMSGDGNSKKDYRLRLLQNAPCGVFFSGNRRVF